MLQQLYIRNYALIKEVRIELANGFTVVTGETGAGKSILLGALGLILGERADTSVLREAAEKCIVEGIFYNDRLKQHPLAVEQEWTAESAWYLRREILPTGKSRAFINDTPVTLTQLQSFAGQLVDLHQQFDTQELVEGDFQRTLLDAMAGQLPEADSYHQAYQQWQFDKRALEQLITEQERSRNEQDYLQHVWQELEEASFKTDEIESLEEQVRVAGQSEGMTQAIAAVLERLQGEGENILLQIRRSHQSLSAYENNSDSLKQWSDRLHAVDLELRDLSQEIDRAADRFRSDPEKLNAWQERLSLGFRLLKKHGCQRTADLLELQAQFQTKLRGVQSLESRIRDLEAQCAKQEKALLEKANQVHHNRLKIIPTWAAQIDRLLKQVGMPTARFQVELRETSLQAYGIDACIFLMDANYSEGMGEPNWQPVRKVASGGELSRLMLCIKSLVADRLDLPTMIFDEIDAGISGEAAKQVGRILQSLGNDKQVICITHQPQVAAKGGDHLHVSKAATGQGIETQVNRLSEEERIETLARMMSGEQPTEAARNNARELRLA